MEHKKKESNGALFGKAIGGICNFLTILFCALRACDVINWSWFWVMSPVFFGYALSLLMFAVVGIICATVLKDEDL